MYTIWSLVCTIYIYILLIFTLEGYYTVCHRSSWIYGTLQKVPTKFMNLLARITLCKNVARALQKLSSCEENVHSLANEHFQLTSVMSTFN